MLKFVPKSLVSLCTFCYPVSSQLRRPVRNVPLGASAQTGGHLFSAVLAITQQRGPESVNPVQQGSTAPQQVSLVTLTGKNISQQKFSDF